MEKTMSDTITLSRKAFSSILSSLIDFYPDPNNPLPPGPWDPVIRRVLHQMQLQSRLVLDGRYRPSPDPWITHDQLRLVYTTALAKEIMNSIATLQDLADTLPDAQSRVIEVANQRLQVFFDDYCGTPPRKSPFPFPHPREGFIEGFRPLELVIIGTQLESTAATLVNGELQQALSALGTKMIEQGVAQL
jgi:hypothetical protein